MAMPVSADFLYVADCGPLAAGDNPLFGQAREAKEHMRASAALPDHKRQLDSRWTGLDATYQKLHSQALIRDAECVLLKAAADATLRKVQSCIAQCDQAAANEVNGELAERDAEYRAFMEKETTYNNSVASWEISLKTFIADAKVAIPKGYTGKRFYHMFSKSWIDGPAITEPSWAARKIKMDVNVEPQQALAGAAFDYKIYQSFGVETEFVDGKIVNAVFVPGSEQQLANTTFGLHGEVRVTINDVTVTSDKTSVVFKRRIEGNPHIIIKAVDMAFAEAVARSWGLNLPATDITIYSELRLTVTADGATPYGEGSSFPTHYFWIREKQSDRRFSVQRQVQPSQYFR
jgi:putative transposon-encoded protein